MASICPLCRRWFGAEAYRTVEPHNRPDGEPCGYEGVGELPQLGAQAE